MAKPKYRASLLRVWWTDEGAWRAVLEDPHTGEKQAFTQPEALLAYLRRPEQPAEALRPNDGSLPQL